MNNADRITTLPKWAQEYINKLQQEADPNNVEIRRLRQQLVAAGQQCLRHKSRYDAMVELVTCAARGGHETCKEFVDRVVAEWLTETED